MSLFSGKNRFILGASGHIAGVINPPAKKKRNYWVGTDKSSHTDPEKWDAAATEVAGSWWPDWYEWLAAHSGKKVKPAKALGSTKHKVIEAAPGSYVKVRAV